MAERDQTPPPSYAEVVKGERRPSEELEEEIRRIVEGFQGEEDTMPREDNEVFHEVFPELVEGISELNPNNVWVTEAAEGKEPEKEKERREGKETEERKRRVRNLLKMSPETPESPIQPSPILASPNRTKRNLIVDLSSDEADTSNLRNEASTSMTSTEMWVEEHGLRQTEERGEPEGKKEENEEKKEEVMINK